jgi:DUF1680 family protein
MLAISGGARYAEVVERALYNAINSGMSLSGPSIVIATRTVTRGGNV